MSNIFYEADAIAALTLIKRDKGEERAALIERILRQETGHFKSKQYKLTGSAGTEDGKWHDLPQGSYTTIQMNDNHIEGDEQLRTFIKWNSVYDFCLYLSDYIDRHDGNFARWNSLDPDRQKEYRKRVGDVKNRIIV